ncbi:MAG TPA: GNAT family N-acetyltransferase [Actinomycetota bacterium]|nr:GNAT family N-acetyltransferase [Actinomycetota bacterium]
MRLIRRATGYDAGACAAIYKPIVEGSIISFEENAPEEAEMRERIESTLEEHEWLVYQEGDRILGYAYSGPFNKRAAYRWSIEISVYVSEDCRGRGIGRELTEALLEHASETGVVNAFAGVALPNPASVALFEKLGFERIALQEQVGYKLGAWHDVGWWQLKLSTAPVPPPARSAG